MNRESSRTGRRKRWSKHTHQVSRFENFFVTTFPRSMPSLSTMRWARSGCDEPENTLILGIVLHCLSIEGLKSNSKGTVLQLYTLVATIDANSESPAQGDPRKSFRKKLTKLVNDARSCSCQMQIGTNFRKLFRIHFFRFRNWLLNLSHLLLRTPCAFASLAVPKKEFHLWKRLFFTIFGHDG